MKKEEETIIWTTYGHRQDAPSIYYQRQRNYSEATLNMEVKAQLRTMNLFA